MPLFMDIHTVDSDTFSVEDVATAHMEDLAIQEKYGVKQLKYWVNVEAKTLFCLMEGPNKKACNDVHKFSHGDTACNIIEVADDEFGLFLGKGKEVNDLAHTDSGDIDTGYRTILLLSVIDITSQRTSHIKETHSIINNNDGVLIAEPNNDIMVSFIHASDAIKCAFDIKKLFDKKTSSIDYTLAMVSGRPVDEEGDNLFEETKKKVEILCAGGLANMMYLDYDTKALVEKSIDAPKINESDFKIIKNDDFTFLIELFGIFQNELHSPDFNSERLQESLGLSKSQTYRKIKAMVGIAPNQLIQELRLRQSLIRIIQTKQTIAEIAYSLGFNSPTYFTRSFRKRFGILPTLFAKNQE